MTSLSQRLAEALASETERADPIAATLARAEMLAKDQAAGEKRRDWAKVLGEIRAMMEQLTSFDLVATDPPCQAILDWMTRAEGMDEFNRLVDLLALRVNELLVQRGAAPASDRRAQRRGMAMDARADHDTLSELAGRESRVLLRL